MEREKWTVRLTQVAIRNIKNTAYGRLALTTGAPRCSGKGSILGIYGQNGSGKTVAVDAMVLLKALLTGGVICPAFGRYIRRGTEQAEVTYGFRVKLGTEEFYVEYQAGLARAGEQHFVLCHEKLSKRSLSGEEKSRMCTLLAYERSDSRGGKAVLRPRRLFSSFEKKTEAMASLEIARRLTEHFDREEGEPRIRSFLFSADAARAFGRARGEAAQAARFLSCLAGFGRYDLTVVENARYGLLSLNPDMLPVNMKLPEEMRGQAIVIKPGEANLVPRQLYPFFEMTVRQINLVLASLVPGVRLELWNVFDRLLARGGEGVQFELATRRDGERIPLLYESAGIKKIISICSSLVDCYNREESCVVVDELDSGIYEYLLGEYLEAMQERARGQLIFTSHNLRPLEVLSREYLAFTTANPENRYLKASCMKDGYNTRLSYLRALRLGGLRENLYQSTNPYEIELALKEAGRMESDEP